MIPIDGWSAHALGRAYGASLAEVQAGLGERRRLAGAGRALHARLLGLYEHVGEEELAAYREYLGAAVRSVSPLLLRLCESQGWDLDALAAGLRPLGAWPPWLCGFRPGDRWLKGIVGSINARPSPTQRSAWRFERLIHGGLVVQDTSGQGITFGLRVLGGCLETAAMLGDHAIRTHGPTGSMTLKVALPETVMAALPGQPLDRLVSHPLLDGAGGVLTEVTGAGRTGTEACFALEPVRWQMPWARTAGAAGASGSAADLASPSETDLHVLWRSAGDDGRERRGIRRRHQS